MSITNIVLEENKKSQDNSSPLLDKLFVILTIVKRGRILKHIYLLWDIHLQDIKQQKFLINIYSKDLWY